MKYQLILRWKKAPTGSCTGNWRFCSTFTRKFKSARPVESYFREHLGLDWPYGGSQPISSQRGRGGESTVFKKSFREPFFCDYSIWSRFSVRLPSLHLALPFISRNGSFGGEECEIQRKREEREWRIAGFQSEDDDTAKDPSQLCVRVCVCVWGVCEGETQHICQTCCQPCVGDVMSAVCIDSFFRQQS